MLINQQSPAMRLYNRLLTSIDLILIALVISFTSFSAQSNTIYKSTDAAGRVTYSDTPTPDAKPIANSGLWANPAILPVEAETVRE